MGLLQDDDYDPDMWDKAEEIPGGFIIQREIGKAGRGEPFFYNDGETGKPVRVPAVPAEAFAYYFQIWDDFHYLHTLPHGRGTLSERRWLVDMLKIFEKSHIEVQNHIEERAARRAQAGK